MQFVREGAGAVVFEPIILAETPADAADRVADRLPVLAMFEAHAASQHGRPGEVKAKASSTPGSTERPYAK